MYTGDNIPEYADPNSVARLLNQKDEHIAELEARLAESETERQEQARLLGISGSVQMKLQAQLAEARAALVAAEESLVTYAGSFGYPLSGKLVIKQVRKALADGEG